MLKTTFLFLLLGATLFSVALKAQDDGDDVVEEINKQRAIPQDNIVDEAKAKPADPTHEDIDLAEEAMKYRKTQQRAQQNIQKANEAFMIHEQLQQLTKDGWSSAKVMDKKVLEVLQKLLATGVLSNQPREQLRAHLLEKMKGSRAEPLLKRFPVLVEIMTDLMRDKEALPGLIRVLGQRDALRKYMIIWVAIFIFSFIFRRKVIKPSVEEMGFIKRNLISLSVTIFFTTISTLIFYFMFKPDVHPTFAIVGRHLFGLS